LTGNSQGGGLALGTAGLVPDVDALAANVPFLTHMRRAVQITDADPYQEIVRYLALHRDLEEQTFTTLAYAVALLMRRRATAHPAREMVVYPYNNHEGGGPAQQRRQLDWLRDHL